MDPIGRYMLFYNLQLGKGGLDLLHLSSSRSGEILGNRTGKEKRCSSEIK